MKRDREDEDEVRDDDGAALATRGDERDDLRNGDDLNGIRKKFKIPDSPRQGVLSNLGDYGEEEEERVKEKVYEYESDEEAERSRAGMRRDTEVRKDCPYLDTVNRQVLVFSVCSFGLGLCLVMCCGVEKGVGVALISVSAIGWRVTEISARLGAVNR